MHKLTVVSGSICGSTGNRSITFQPDFDQRFGEFAEYYVRVVPFEAMEEGASAKSNILEGLARDIERLPAPLYLMDVQIAQAFGLFATPPHPYTASMDMAMTLRPESIVDWRVQTARHRKGYHAAFFGPTVTYSGEGATAALAVCAAAVRMKAAETMPGTLKPGTPLTGRDREAGRR